MAVRKLENLSLLIILQLRFIQIELLIHCYFHLGVSVLLFLQLINQRFIRGTVLQVKREVGTVLLLYCFVNLLRLRAFVDLDHLRWLALRTLEHLSEIDNWREVVLEFLFFFIDVFVFRSLQVAALWLVFIHLLSEGT